ncbi:MAG: MurR/RpiR family transcriptional regulator [Ruminococcaceae bacterium]|nr:MurR/RpiR family transcriptional regulator [Oscillospiraceae bacterium]
MPALSKGQKLIANYIIQNYDKAAYMTASALGAEVGVSESTVVRFANEIGFDGYPELQSKIRDTVRVRLTSVQRMESANIRMGEAEILDSILLNDAERIKSTLDTLDRAEFAKAVDLILGAKNIYIMGMRSSAVLAEFVNYYFGLLFDNVRLIRPAGGSEIFEHLMKIHSDDVLIAISFPRYTTGIVNAVEYAASTGARVVAITDSLSSPIVPHASAALVAKSDMASFVDSLVAPMSLINALIAYIGKKKHNEVTETLGRLEAVWKEYNVYTSGVQG